MSGTVKGDVAAAIDLVYLYAARGEEFAGGDYVALARIAPEGDDWRVLYEEKRVADTLLLAEFDESLLQAESGGVIATAEIEDGDHLLIGYCGREGCAG